MAAGETPRFRKVSRVVSWFVYKGLCGPHELFERREVNFQEYLMYIPLSYYFKTYILVFFVLSNNYHGSVLHKNSKGSKNGVSLTKYLYPRKLWPM